MLDGGSGEPFSTAWEEKNARRNHREWNQARKVMENMCEAFTARFVGALVCNQLKHLRD